MNKVELWRRNSGLSQRGVAELLKATDAVVVSAEKGRPIRAEYITAYLRAGAGFLASTDFIEAAPKGTKEDGPKKTSGDPKGGRAGK